MYDYIHSYTVLVLNVRGHENARVSRIKSVFDCTTAEGGADGARKYWI